MALRGLFIIDPNGVLQYQVVHNLSVGRRSDEVLRVLDGLQTGGLCPETGYATSPRSIRRACSLPTAWWDNTASKSRSAAVRLAWSIVLATWCSSATVALKIFRAARWRGFTRAARRGPFGGGLEPPQFCTIFTVDDSHGLSMIVMEYVDGQSAQKTARSRPPDDRRRQTHLRQIAMGMAAAHANQIVHGDLKPANIMVSRGRLVKIMDFGLARRQAEASPTSETGTWETADPSGLSGTPTTCRPSRRSEPASPQSDVFALALVIYEMLTGEKAVRGDNLLSVLRPIDTLDADRYSAGMPEPFATILRRDLVTTPSRRDITMADVAELLEWRDYTIAPA